MGDAAGLRSPDAIGPYRNLQPIGEGGFAIVFRAEQTEPVQRPVALKLLKPGLDSTAVLRRFDAERQALAMMDHPNIAKVFDAGATDQGRPYFVMELVEGEPITKFCDKHGLSMHERLSLVQDICAAVQHAHQKGVIHRDLKPSNILVSLVDEKPLVKVIDFGIAKATEMELTAQTIFTHQGQLVGTPEYMSPEQASVGSLHVDTRTDVFSLGVVLYRLLTGHLPFSSETLREGGLAEIMRVLREVDPPRPSARVRDSKGETEEFAARIGTNSSTLVRRLRGELDWIVLKAMEKDPDRRYESPSRLAADIDSYLRDRPLEAGPPTVSYRLAKFAKRHRVFLGTVALIIVALSYALFESNRRRIQVEAARQDALAALDEAEAVTFFLTEDLLSAADPQQGRRDITVLEVLNDAAGMIDDFSDRPRVRARLQIALGRTFDRLGELNRAKELLESAVETNRRELGEKNRDTLFTRIHYANTLANLGHSREAEAEYRDILAIRLSIMDEGHDHVLATYSNLGQVLSDLGELEEAELVLRKAIDGWIAIDNHTKHVEDILGAEGILANVYAVQGRLDEAERVLLDTLDRWRASAGDDDSEPGILATLNNLGMLRYDQGRYAECDSMLEYTLERRKVVLGDDHFITMESSYNLATLRSILGDYPQALVVYQELLPVVREELGEENRLAHAVINGMAFLHLKLGDPDAAEPYAREALEIRRRVLGDQNPQTLSSLSNLGLAYRAQGRLDLAEAPLRETFEGRRRELGEDHRQTLSSMTELGTLYRLQGELDRSRQTHEAASATIVEALGDAHQEYFRSRLELARTLRALGDDAETELLSVVLSMEERLGADHDLTQGVYRELAELYAARGDASTGALWRGKLVPPEE